MLDGSKPYSAHQISSHSRESVSSTTRICLILDGQRRLFLSRFTQCWMGQKPYSAHQISSVSSTTRICLILDGQRRLFLSGSVKFDLIQIDVSAVTDTEYNLFTFVVLCTFRYGNCYINLDFLVYYDFIHFLRFLFLWTKNSIIHLWIRII